MSRKNNKEIHIFAKDTSSDIFMMWNTLQIEYPKRKTCKWDKLSVQNQKYIEQKEKTSFSWGFSLFAHPVNK